MRKPTHAVTFATLILAWLALTPLAAVAAAVLFFSDLESGPKSGWEGSATKGAAVTVWGKGLGATRSASYVTVNGAALTSAADYAEWGTTGTANGIPRGLERITFWLNSSAQDGAGTISVSVNGETSNALPFTVRSGNIYFISVTDGDNGFNGRYASAQGGSNGPWKDLRMAMHHNNTAVNAGDTLYVRGGTYTQTDVDGAFMRGRCDYGTAGAPVAAVAYPAEVPHIDQQNVAGGKRGAFSVESGTYDGSYGVCNLGHGADYFTFAKLKVSHGGEAFVTWGKGYRIVGNHLQDNLDETWSGVVMVDTSHDVRIYGNYFEHNGYDMYKHNIYVKTHDRAAVGTMTEVDNVDIGWNEFDRWTADLNPDTQTKPSRGGTIEVQTEGTAYANGKRTRRVFVHDNYFHDGDSQALYAGDVFPLGVYNNVFANISSAHGGIRLWNTDANSLFFHNTFFRAASASAPVVSICGGSCGSTFARWKNNVFSVYPGQSYAAVETPSVFDSDHDLFFGNGAPAGANVLALGSVLGDPLFVNAAAGDFHLQSASPARDAGTSSVAALVTADFDGNLRPQDAGYDIGAFEYAGTYVPPPVDTTPPAAPTNLTVQ